MSVHQGKPVLPRVVATAAVIFITTLSATAVGPACAQTASALIKEGNDAYRHDECVRAAARYYALQVHYPDWLTESQSRTIYDRIAWCEQNSTVNASSKTDQAGAPDPTNKPGGTLGLSPPASDRCRLYAQIAVAQYRVNRVDGCGYSDSRWTDDYHAHYDWCAAVGNDALDAENMARQRGLITCHRH